MNPVEVGLVVYPHAQWAAIHGLTDLFRVANRLSLERGGPTAKQLRVSHWQLAQQSDQLERTFDTHSLPPGKLTALVLPPSLDTEPGGDAIAPHVRWLISPHASGTIVCSVCAGAFLLAESGLLDGRSATTHWIHKAAFERRFPDVHVDVDRLLINDGDIVTAGGLMAWVDLGLSLVERYINPTTMLATARYLLVDPSDRQQRFYSNFAPALAHGDKAVLKVQHWLQNHCTQSVTIAQMSEHAILGQRTFLRRFQNATGMTPTEYVRHLRVEKSRESLELSKLSVKQIAWMVGYEDPGSFRKVFQNVMGLSPGDYRRRFGIAST